MTTISASTTVGIVITNSNTAAYTNPIVIDAGVNISRPTGGSANAFAAYSGVWTVVNHGTISAINPNVGLYLLDGGTVTNTNSALISGGTGVAMGFTAASVMNYGAIAGNARNGEGVDLKRGGSASNAASASITGAVAGIEIQYYGGTVSNDGTVAATSTTYASFGIYFDHGGTITNQSAGTVSGDSGIKIAGGAGALANDARITGSTAYAVGLLGGGSINNAVTGTITGPVGISITGGTGTVINAGHITGTAATAGYAIELLAGGSVTNAASGSITGDGAITAAGGNATLLNQGHISGSVSFAGAATITNAASAAMDGVAAGDGTLLNQAVIAGVVSFGAGGSVTNASSASIDGVTITGAIGTILNDGSMGGVYFIDGSSFTNTTTSSNIGGKYGVEVVVGTSITPTGRILLNNGRISGGVVGVLVPIYTVTNASSGAITGGSAGIDMKGGTVVNDGSISGGTGIYIYDGGAVTNAASATVTGGSASGERAIRVSRAAGTLDNSGSIGGDIYFQLGGRITNEASASITGSAQAIRIIAAAGTVVNEGSIIVDAATTVANAAGIVLADGGAVTNAASATISGGYGIRVTEQPGTVINAGGITGTGSSLLGIRLIAGGYVSNASSGVISSLEIDSAAGTVLNAGAIIGLADLSAGGYVSNHGVMSEVAIATALGAIVNAGTMAGVGLGFGGSVNNSGTILGSVLLGAGKTNTGAGGPATYTYGSTLRDPGTITGSNGTAVIFNGPGGAGWTGHNQLVLYPASHLSGAVYHVGTRTSDRLDLMSGSSMGTVTSGIFSGFSLVSIDSGLWYMSGGRYNFRPAIDGFTLGDTIHITGFTATGSSYAPGTIGTRYGLGSLVLESASGETKLYMSGAPGLTNLIVTDVSGGTDVTSACYLAGTRILTDAGEVAVEELRPGMRAVLAEGRVVPIIGVKRRRIDLSRYLRRAEVWPVRITPGAFGDQVPHRPLHVSPDHAVFIHGVLIPVRHLVNGVSIAQVACAEVEYFHVELARHGVLLAAGLPAESYLDTGNRTAFENDAHTVQAAEW